ncbi:hypothetical protein BDM02DRAFT_3122117 [Thelephora ganbajun]|uniref:Uncharacterized protein n=1 Tax=Thelephora ganbajun TaxID=370292 RepID=A0ACB6Z3Y4_THEGA|nr:hypothetical protein BDM02DRAFT_3122117 [Thelephora ganbajun]
MATSSAATVADVICRKKIETEVATVLVHLKKLLRVRNQYRSPLLRLPTEITIHILSFVMENMGSSPVWRSIFATCYHIRTIMCNATILWRKVDLSLGRAAEYVLMKSKGNPLEVVARFNPGDELGTVQRGSVLLHWKDQWVHQGCRLRALAFYGPPSSLPRLSWIFEMSLPCLDRLKFHVIPGIHDDVMSNPIPLQLPTGTPLRELDLRNVTLPWSSDLFTGLRELHLDFRDVTVSIMEDELIRIFEVSPRLESLSLLHFKEVIPADGHQQLSPKRIVRLPALTLLELDNDPKVIGYTLACMDTPALASLKIRSRTSNWDAARSLNYFFPDNRLPKELFSDPPVLKVWRPDQLEEIPFLGFGIGSLEVHFEIDVGDAEATHCATAACFQLVPPSVTTLKLESVELDIEEWRKFFRSHPEVRSIKCTDFHGGPMSRSFWDALAPEEHRYQAILCPRLEYIHCKMYTDEAEQLKLLTICLWHRRSAGFKLRHLKITEPKGWAHTVADIIDSMVEVLEIDFPSKAQQKWGRDCLPYELNKFRIF